MATLEQIQTQIKKLEAKAQTLLTVKSESALKQIRDLMVKHGLTTSDIETYTGKKGKRTVAASQTAGTPDVTAKYVDPATGATWSGRGRAPGWVANATNRDRFLAGAIKLQPVPQAKRAGNYPRGPQPAKYADPKSGATWSGRGRVPAWLADVKDRDAFLITGAENTGGDGSEAATVSGAKATRKTAAKKASPAVKKVTAKKSAGGARKVGAKKTAAGKTAAKKVTGKKAVTKSVAVKKVVAKKVAGKKSASVKAARKVPAAPVSDGAQPGTSGAASATPDTKQGSAA
ncbi:histone family protein nucleoid-structuring protein H-NS [Paraburkholderia hospita]|uniref:Histone family protein nucleoid-structuring protein H-NS n=1 Tax=Paraburkholderia hospita TaxID=169430 RepID=A0ABP2PNV5_9BURK|nr:H-NS family nucleoid-associated regulatory protein [Paraburkholderia hospita]EIM99506.1 histone family protein nucleoid-structuring protein H-NS [Paraburkholderia hospita]OUL70252.1 hypothetical protein CA602_48285 [Paraburkholderia hospita]